MTREELLSRDPVLFRVAQGEEVLWRNPRLCPFDGVESTLPLHRGDILAAEARLHRFAPLIRAAFPETADQGGLIESPLRPIPGMQAALERFRSVRQVQLLTDDTEKTKRFYRSLGLLTLPELGCCGFMRP